MERLVQELCVILRLKDRRNFFEGIKMHYEKPNKNEIPIVKTQRKLALCSLICVLLLIGASNLWEGGILINAIAVLVFILLCISIALYVISVLGNGFIARSGYVIRDGFHIFLFLVRLAAILFVGILVITNM